MVLEEEQKNEVERDLKDKTIINAPPGTGKTETIIQKLVYIHQNKLASLNDILVICFSRAAVKTIKERVEQITGIRNRVEIRTIDSFCSWVIKELIDDYKEIFNNMDYDQRIEYVIDLINRENEEKRYRIITQINTLKHIIVDEFQDIVGVRAKFIETLFNVNKGCGFTLLGDEYQAIYNYQAKEMTSDELIKRIKEKNPGCKEIEFRKQHRIQDINKTKKMQYIRGLIRISKNNGKKLNEIMSNCIFPNIEIKKIEYTQDDKIAILARKNGEVYEIASKLKDTPYIIQKYTNEITLPAWIAYLLSDEKQTFIKRYDFEEKAKKRLDVADANKYWDYCKEIENIEKFSDYTPDELDIKTFRDNLIVYEEEIPNNIEQDENKLILSTIHKAKGREYDEVYLYYKEKDFLQEKELQEIFDNIRLLYVAITRAKNEYYKYDKEITGVFFNSFNENKKERYYEYKYGKKSFKKIKKIEIGLSGDVDEKSFIDPEIVGNVEENQEYIYKNIKKGDFVDIIKENDVMYIYHKDKRIGKVEIGDLYKKTIINANPWLRKRKYKTDFRDAVEYKNVRVKDIITVSKFTKFIEDKYASPYKETGLWLAVQLEGFGEIKYEIYKK